MSEINLFHTPGVNPAEQPGLPATCAVGPSTLIAKKTDAAGAYALTVESNPEAVAKIDAGSCDTLELPVLSGAGQIYGADGKPAGSVAH